MSDIVKEFNDCRTEIIDKIFGALGVTTLVEGKIVIPHLRRAYEFWEALEQPS